MIAALLSLVGWLDSPEGHLPRRHRIVRPGMPTLFYIECGCGEFKTPQSLHKQTAANHWRDHSRTARTSGA